MKLFFLFSVGSVLLAQTFPVTRTPAPQTRPNLQDIAADVQALEQAEPAVPGFGKSAVPIPKDFKPRTDVPLSPTAAAAVLASQQLLHGIPPADASLAHPQNGLVPKGPNLLQAPNSTGLPNVGPGPLSTLPPRAAWMRTACPCASIRRLDSPAISLWSA